MDRSVGVSEGFVKVDGLDVRALLLPDGRVSVNVDDLWKMGK